VHFCLGVRAFARGHKNRYIMAVLSTILGGSMSSRLFTQVREERGIAYYIKSYINTYFDNGYLMVQAGVDLNRLEEAIKVVLSEFNKFKGGKNEVKSRELVKAKEYLKGRFVLGLEDSKQLASLFTEDLLLEGKIRTPKEIIACIEKVGLNDIKKTAKKIFTDQGLNLAVIGPYKDKSRFAKILKL